MDLFLDCEWADPLASELVSLALVGTAADQAFYAEREPLPDDPTPWVRTVVYPLLQRGEAALSDVDLTRRLREFIASLPDPCIYYESGLDRDLCQYAIDGFEVAEPLGPYPANLHWRRCDSLEKGKEQWWHQNRHMDRHHALNDAMALRAAFLCSQPASKK